MCLLLQISTESQLAERARLEQRIEDLEAELHSVRMHSYLCRSVRVYLSFYSNCCVMCAGGEGAW